MEIASSNNVKYKRDFNKNGSASTKQNINSYKKGVSLKEKIIQFVNRYKVFQFASLVDNLRHPPQNPNENLFLNLTLDLCFVYHLSLSKEQFDSIEFGNIFILKLKPTSHPPVIICVFKCGIEKKKV